MDTPPSQRDDFWYSYALNDYDYADFAAGARVLDLGCGEGVQLLRLRKKGYQAVGLDPSPNKPSVAAAARLPYVRARAEALPFRDSTFQGVVCKGVLPFTEEATALEEMNRVMQPEAELDLVTLGVGYYLRYALTGAFKHRLYGLRTIFNTWVYALSHRRLPGFLGNTVYQSRRRLSRQFKRSNFELVRTTPSPGFLLFPVFIYHRMRKRVSTR